MNELEQGLIARFGADKVKAMDAAEGDFPLLILDLEMRSEIKVVMTNGLSNFTMPVPEKFAGKEHVELYFCLPSYWDLDNPHGQWIFEWIRKMAKHVVEKHTWFGIGHTFPNGNPAVPLSPTMKQKYLMLNEPVFLEKELSPLQLNDFEVNFLGIIPLFEDELDYKMGKGTYKLLRKMEAKGISELLDDFRLSALKSKWRVLKR